MPHPYDTHLKSLKKSTQIITDLIRLQGYWTIPVLTDEEKKGLELKSVKTIPSKHIFRVLAQALILYYKGDEEPIKYEIVTVNKMSATFYVME